MPAYFQTSGYGIYLCLNPTQAGNYFCLVGTGYNHNKAAQLVDYGPEVRN